MNIFLIGYRCTGKSTVGKMISESLSLPFIDMDNEIVAGHKMTILKMVQKYGWKYFREKEEELLQKICESDNQVVSTGGGIILSPKNIRLIRNSGVAIWLRAEPKTIMKRIAGDPDSTDYRPSLTTDSPDIEIKETLHERTPLYIKAMNFFIETDGVSEAEISKNILEEIKSRFKDA